MTWGFHPDQIDVRDELAPAGELAGPARASAAGRKPASGPSSRLSRWPGRRTRDSPAPRPRGGARGWPRSSRATCHLVPIGDDRLERRRRVVDQESDRAAACFRRVAGWRTRGLSTWRLSSAPDLSDSRSIRSRSPAWFPSTIAGTTRCVPLHEPASAAGDSLERAAAVKVPSSSAEGTEPGVLVLASTFGRSDCDPAGRNLCAVGGDADLLFLGARWRPPLRGRGRSSVTFAGEVVAVAVVTVRRLLGCKGQFGSPWLVSTPKAPRIELRVRFRLSDLVQPVQVTLRVLDPSVSPPVARP